MSNSNRRRVLIWLLIAGVTCTLVTVGAVNAARENDGYLFHDAHFHLTNYIQQGTDIRDFVKIMGKTVGRSTLFGIPLQQQWSYANTGDFAPTYYLHTDAPLYYYSLTDAAIAMGITTSVWVRSSELLASKAFTSSSLYSISMTMLIVLEVGSSAFRMA